MGPSVHVQPVPWRWHRALALLAISNMGPSVHVQPVETFNAACLRPVLQKRKFSFILVGGGAPCQGNCPLNSHRKGLLDPRTRAAEYIPQIAADVKKLPEARDLTVLKFLKLLFIYNSINVIRNNMSSEPLKRKN